MKKALVCLGISFVASVATFAGPVSAGGDDKVSICHLDGDTGTYELLSVGPKAVDAHDAHGDGRPDGAVPGMAGYEFDDSCSPVADPWTAAELACEAQGGTFALGAADTNVLWTCDPVSSGSELVRTGFLYCVRTGGDSWTGSVSTTVGTCADLS